MTEEIIKDFYMYKFMREQPFAVAYQLEKYKGIPFDEALESINKFLVEINK